MNNLEKMDLIFLNIKKEQTQPVETVLHVHTG